MKELRKRESHIYFWWDNFFPVMSANLQSRRQNLTVRVPPRSEINFTYIVLNLPIKLSWLTTGGGLVFYFIYFFLRFQINSPTTYAVGSTDKRLDHPKICDKAAVICSTQSFSPGCMKRVATVTTSHGRGPCCKTLFMGQKFIRFAPYRHRLPTAAQRRRRSPISPSSSSWLELSSPRLRPPPSIDTDHLEVWDKWTSS